MANGAALFAPVGGQSQKVGCKVVAAAFLEFGQKIPGPIGAVDFQAVAEDGVGWMVAESLHEAVADETQVVLDGGMVVMVEHRAFGTDRGALDGLAGGARDEEPNALVARHLVRVKLAKFACRGVEGRDYLFVGGELG